jgi:hypothetical protein
MLYADNVPPQTVPEPVIAPAAAGAGLNVIANAPEVTVPQPL